jgi:hypothetical protein
LVAPVAEPATAAPSTHTSICITPSAVSTELASHYIGKRGVDNSTCACVFLIQTTKREVELEKMEVDELNDGGLSDSRPCRSPLCTIRLCLPWHRPRVHPGGLHRTRLNLDILVELLFMPWSAPLRPPWRRRPRLATRPVLLDSGSEENTALTSSSASFPAPVAQAPATPTTRGDPHQPACQVFDKLSELRHHAPVREHPQQMLLIS